MCVGVSGQVCVNGQAISGTAMGRLAGYVLQDDVLPSSSTVQEYLRSACCSSLMLIAATDTVCSRRYWLRLQILFVTANIDCSHRD